MAPVLLSGHRPAAPKLLLEDENRPTEALPEMTTRQKGFTLIELLIVVAIIGILAVIAIPNLLTALQRTRQKRSMADMRSIATAWEARATDINAYNGAGLTWPATSAGASSLSTLLAPTYVKSIPVYDGWDIEFKVSQGNATTYAIKSFGADKIESYTGTTAAAAITTNNFDCDIIVADGAFVVYPDGVQGQ
jgi:type II secretion system protein G